MKQRWGGLLVANTLRIVWCHPAQVAQQWYQATPQTPVWPVIPGLGPQQGLTVALHKAGVREPKELIVRVLEMAHRWVYDGFGEPPAAAA